MGLKVLGEERRARERASGRKERFPRRTSRRERGSRVQWLAGGGEGASREKAAGQRVESMDLLTSRLRSQLDVIHHGPWLSRKRVSAVP